MKVGHSFWGICMAQNKNKRPYINIYAKMCAKKATDAGSIIVPCQASELWLIYVLKFLQNIE